MFTVTSCNSVLCFSFLSNLFMYYTCMLTCYLLSSGFVNPLQPAAVENESKKEDDAGKISKKSSKKDNSDFIKLRVVGQVLLILSVLNDAVLLLKTVKSKNQVQIYNIASLLPLFFIADMPKL